MKPRPKRALKRTAGTVSVAFPVDVAEGRPLALRLYSLTVSVAFPVDVAEVTMGKLTDLKLCGLYSLTVCL
jgi:hypothetical protein